MFRIPVWDLLASYSGDTKKFSFNGPVVPGYFADIELIKPLSFEIEIIALDDGVEIVFENLTTTVVYEGRNYPITIGNFSRTFKTHIDPLLDPDDIRPIENTIVDLSGVLREEIIMACHF